MGANFRRQLSQILDLNNWDRSWVINTPSQSGQPGSPHSDLLQLWDVDVFSATLFTEAVGKPPTG
jgi:hypothetical protein